MLNLFKHFTPTSIQTLNAHSSKIQKVFEKERNQEDIKQFFDSLAGCSNLLELIAVIRVSLNHETLKEIQKSLSNLQKLTKLDFLLEEIISNEKNSVIADLFLNLPNLTSFLIYYPKLQQNDLFLIGKALSKMTLLKSLRIQVRQQIKNEEIQDISQSLYQLPALKEVWFDFILSYSQKDHLDNIFEALSKSSLLVNIRLYLKMNDQNFDHQIHQVNQINYSPTNGQKPHKKFDHLCRVEKLRIFSIFTNMNYQEICEDGFSNFIQNCSSLKYLKIDVSIEYEDIMILPNNLEPNTNLKELSLDLCISKNIQQQSNINLKGLSQLSSLEILSLEVEDNYSKDVQLNILDQHFSKYLKTFKIFYNKVNVANDDNSFSYLFNISQSCNLQNFTISFESCQIKSFSENLVKALIQIKTLNSLTIFYNSFDQNLSQADISLLVKSTQYFSNLHTFSLTTLCLFMGQKNNQRRFLLHQKKLVKFKLNIF
ncbi:hypothetical protein ABPG72_015271 [Tetrahymena utriculariae]